MIVNQFVKKSKKYKCKHWNTFACLSCENFVNKKPEKCKTRIHINVK